jgi:hypothetical protein
LLVAVRERGEMALPIKLEELMKLTAKGATDRQAGKRKQLLPPFPLQGTARLFARAPNRTARSCIRKDGPAWELFTRRFTGRSLLCAQQ